jgi:hypothetical protein
LPNVSMDHRVEPGGDEEKSAAETSNHPSRAAIAAASG